MAEDKDLKDIPCLVMCGEESTMTTYQTVMRSLTIQAFIEAYGRDAAVRQLITVWRQEWDLSNEEMAAHIKQITSAVRQ